MLHEFYMKPQKRTKLEVWYPSTHPVTSGRACTEKFHCVGPSQSADSKIFQITFLFRLHNHRLALCNYCPIHYHRSFYLHTHTHTVCSEKEVHRSLHLFDWHFAARNGGGGTPAAIEVLYVWTAQRPRAGFRGVQLDLSSHTRGHRQTDHVVRELFGAKTAFHCPSVFSLIRLTEREIERQKERAIRKKRRNFKHCHVNKSPQGKREPIGGPDVRAMRAAAGG